MGVPFCAPHCSSECFSSGTANGVQRCILHASVQGDSDALALAKPQPLSLDFWRQVEPRTIVNERRRQAFLDACTVACMGDDSIWRATWHPTAASSGAYIWQANRQAPASGHALVNSSRSESWTSPWMSQQSSFSGEPCLSGDEASSSSSSFFFKTLCRESWTPPCSSQSSLSGDAAQSNRQASPSPPNLVCSSSRSSDSWISQEDDPSTWRGIQVRQMVDFLGSNKDEEVSAALLALSMLTADNPHNVRAAYDAGALELLVKYLGSHQSGTRTAAAKTLRNICTEGSEYRRAFARLGTQNPESGHPLLHVFIHARAATDCSSTSK